ncbi:branched-chain amino acid aminotransferase [Staphylococcus felis]|uniref:Branched-chain amino acid aminotransferase n=2 Tax=Staphylococcus felis TaxID=46127 RepID=A0A3E0INY3_9STAP|nr:branched-chain amino acid aminotransferase [Staphylococcus felis]
MNYMTLKLGLNKFEKTLVSMIFATIAVFSVAFMSLDVTWVLDKFGIKIGTPTINEIINYVANGGAIVTAFAVIAGITLPAWVGPAVAAFATTAA